MRRFAQLLLVTMLGLMSHQTVMAAETWSHAVIILESDDQITDQVSLVVHIIPERQ